MGLVLPRSDGAYTARADADALKFRTVQRRTTIPVNDQIAYRDGLNDLLVRARLTPNRLQGRLILGIRSTAPVRSFQARLLLD